MPTPEPKPVDLVAAEAVAIVQQARVTAVLLEARAQATDLVQQARLAGGTPTWADVEAVVYASPSPTLAGDRTEATPMGEAATSPDVEAGSGVPENPASPV